MRTAAAQPSPQPEEPPHSPLPLAKRRRRRIADSDEEEEAATPTSARYAARACSSAAVEAGVYPPLAEDAGLEVVQRFAEIFQGKALPEPKNVKKVAPESLLAAFRQNLDAHGLKRERDTVSGSTQIIVVQRPAQDKVVNFRTPDDCPEEKYYSVPNALMASKMTQLGYKKIGITHLPPDVDTLPPAVGELTRAAASRRRAGAPATARVCPCRAYNRCPDIDKAASAPTAAIHTAGAVDGEQGRHGDRRRAKCVLPHSSVDSQPSESCEIPPGPVYAAGGALQGLPVCAPQHERARVSNNQCKL